MKRIVSLVLAFILTLGLSACTDVQNTSVANAPTTDGGAQDYGYLGRLSKLNVSDEELNEAVKDHIDQYVYSGFIFYDNLNSMLMALNNGEIGMLAIDLNSANYIASRHENCVVRVPDWGVNMMSFSMLLREEDTELRNNISEIMRQMNLDGTTEALKHTYIDDVIAGEDPEAVVPQEFENAKTIKVAVTGDRPPMDYISAGGEPMGFNTALIAEVAKRLEMNVEFVSMDSAARGVSLATGVSDVVFWMEHTDFGNWDGADVEDQPEHTIATEAYLTSPYSLVVLDSSPLAEILQAP